MYHDPVYLITLRLPRAGLLFFSLQRSGVWSDDVFFYS